MSADRALEEPDPVVEQVEALEAVADEVEVGLEAGDALAGQASGADRGSGEARKRSATQTRAVGQLVGVEVGPHEDGAAAAAGAALDEVAGDLVGADGVEAALEVVERGPAHGGVGQERRGRARRRARPGRAARARARR